MISIPGWEEFCETNKSAFGLAFRVLKRPENSPFIPNEEDIFAAYYSCALKDVRVIIVGESPYPTIFENGVTESCGLAFSGRPGYRIPASLRYIFEELNRQYPDLKTQTDGNLRNWCRQGVLLLNSRLTYHPKKQKLNFWCGIVERTLLECIKYNNDVIIVAWGKVAQDAISNDVRKAIQNSNVKILECGHPSPLNTTGSFQGNGHFIRINEILRELGQPEIDWNTA